MPGSQLQKPRRLSTTVSSSASSCSSSPFLPPPFPPPAPPLHLFLILFLLVLILPSLYPLPHPTPRCPPPPSSSVGPKFYVWKSMSYANTVVLNSAHSAVNFDCLALFFVCRSVCLFVRLCLILPVYVFEVFVPLHS